MTKLTLQLSAVAIGSALLIGCAKKPPACSDADVLQGIQEMVVSNVQRSLEPPVSTANVVAVDVQKFLGRSMTELLRDDPQGIQASYFKTLKVELSNLVSDGYNEQARRNSCRGQLSISTASGRQLSRELAFTTQVSETKGKNYVLGLQDFDPFVDAVSKDMTSYYSAKRLQGEWSGTYSCGGIDGAADGPQGPYQMPVAVTVDDMFEAKLERSTRGGGIEVLQGKMNQYLGELTLAGKGQNSADDTWHTSFKGTVKGLELEATGQVATPEGRRLRQCKLILKIAEK